MAKPTLTKIKQRFVAGEIFRRRREGEFTMVHHSTFGADARLLSKEGRATDFVWVVLEVSVTWNEEMGKALELKPSGRTGREQAKFVFGGAYLPTSWVIEIQCGYRSSPDRSQSFNAIVIEPKVVCPSLLNRMKQRNPDPALWIDCADSVGFVQVARWASQGQVCQF